MNKELIKQYKAEFDHWLNGGSLEERYSDNGSYWHTSVTVLWNNPNMIYVINDVYVEFRKALVEGKTIEKNYGSMGFGYPNKWDAFSTKFGVKFEHNIECYRIKPDEPQFKVGDWVRAPSGKVYCVTETNLIHGTEHFIQWQPTEGEWVYSIKDTDSFEVYRYKHYTNPRPCQPFIGVLPEGLACS